MAAEERVALAALKLQGHSLRQIAKQLGRSPSTLSPEVRRNGGGAGHSSQQSCAQCCCANGHFPSSSRMARFGPSSATCWAGSLRPSRSPREGPSWQRFAGFHKR
ncbi:helix-turn-helix domain-containing protein [Inhella sp. 4Y17]|uniref:Helix-turn-helix domain-containing protein n=1 Tax=Inhella gelatinilytica TaxID=2795030 RepID=A0A931IYK3_9BURK|nr:helix-turn-helix domain-containing protein [Inhella gelatinilytica]MBH9553976.1 helix-turn-helix domain-containing protein [Inhella gelatinilytica]